jgi:hypothetical protein
MLRGNETEARRLLAMASTDESARVNRYLAHLVLSYTPRGVPQGGWHPLDVKVPAHRYRLTARRGYQR